MRYIFFILTLLVFQTSRAQEVEEEIEVFIHMKVYNNTNHDLTLLYTPKHLSYPDNRANIVHLSKQDTTEFEHPIKLEEDQVPQSVYQFSIYEAVNYYYINDHYYWECDRIEGETYSCIHTLMDYIQIDTNAAFDSLQFRLEEKYDGPIYEHYDLEKEAIYPTGWEGLFKDFENSGIIKSNEEDAKFYLEFVVEVDSSISNLKILKSSHEDQNELVLEYFKSLKFIPGFRNNVAVRSKVVIPLIIRFND